MVRNKRRERIGAARPGGGGDPTRVEYHNFAEAYDHFNRELFGGALPACYITLQRRARTWGYFFAARFGSRHGDGSVDELALNPAGFKGKSDAWILGVLVHE